MEIKIVSNQEKAGNLKNFAVLEMQNILCKTYRSWKKNHSVFQLWEFSECIKKIQVIRYVK